MVHRGFDFPCSFLNNWESGNIYVITVCVIFDFVILNFVKAIEILFELLNYHFLDAVKFSKYSVVFFLFFNFYLVYTIVPALENAQQFRHKVHYKFSICPYNEKSKIRSHRLF